MPDKKYFTQSIVLDDETDGQLNVMATSDDRTRSALMRTLIRQEYARRYSVPNPVITVTDAQQAAQ